MRAITEKRRAPDTNIFAGSLPSIASTVNQANTMVNAPNIAGKNLIQNRLPPSRKITFETKEVKGGTEINPKAK